MTTPANDIMKPVKTLHTAYNQKAAKQPTGSPYRLDHAWFLVGWWKQAHSVMLYPEWLRRNTMAGGAHWATWLVLSKKIWMQRGPPYIKTKEPGWMMFTLNQACILSGLLAVRPPAAWSRWRVVPQINDAALANSGYRKMNGAGMMLKRNRPGIFWSPGYFWYPYYKRLQKGTGTPAGLQLAAQKNSHSATWNCL